MPLQSRPETVCLLRLSAIGDTCHALAVARRIQDSNPATRLTWIIGKTEAALLGDIPDIEFIIFDKKSGLSGYRDLRRRLRDRKFDALLCMQLSLRANLLVPLIPAARKIGFDGTRAREGHCWVTNEQVPPLPRAHVLDGMMQFAAAIGADSDSLRWDIPIADQDAMFARKLVSGRERTVLISPCSSQRRGSFRNWSIDSYAEVAQFAIDELGCQVLVSGTGTPEEHGYGEAIENRLGRHVQNLVGKTSLKQLYALIAAADVVLCPDSGPAHMATAAGTPVVGLYAASNPVRAAPYLSKHLVANAYPQAVRELLGQDPDEVRFGTRVRKPGAMDLIRTSEVKKLLRKSFEG